MRDIKMILLSVFGWCLAYWLAVLVFPFLPGKSPVIGVVFSFLSAALCVALSAGAVAAAVTEFRGAKIILFLIPCIALIYTANSRVIKPVDIAGKVLVALEQEAATLDGLKKAIDGEVARQPEWLDWELKEDSGYERSIVQREGTTAMLYQPLTTEHRQSWYPAAPEKCFPSIVLTMETGRNASLIMVINLSLLVLAVSLGGLLCSVVEKVSYIIPLSIVAGVADVWSVFFGATEEMVRDMETARYFLISFPLMGKPDIVPMIGVTDFVFFGLYIQLVRKFNLGVKRNIVWLLSTFFLVLLVAIITHAGIPVLPFMAVGFLIINWKHLPFDKEDKKSTLIMVLFLLVLFGFITWMKG